MGDFSVLVWTKISSLTKLSDRQIPPLVNSGAVKTFHFLIFFLVLDSSKSLHIFLRIWKLLKSTLIVLLLVHAVVKLFFSEDFAMCSSILLIKDS